VIAPPEITIFICCYNERDSVVPTIETAHRETPSPFNVLGLKGVGEAGCIPTGAVFAQAVEDALGPDAGVEIAEIPLSPNRLFQLMERGRQS
jgi:CO/xanthine dehydrogenase Mo-binding subunit